MQHINLASSEKPLILCNKLHNSQQCTYTILMNGITSCYERPNEHILHLFCWQSSFLWLPQAYWLQVLQRYHRLALCLPLLWQGSTEGTLHSTYDWLCVHTPLIKDIPKNPPMLSNDREFSQAHTMYMYTLLLYVWKEDTSLIRASGVRCHCAIPDCQFVDSAYKMAGLTQHTHITSPIITVCCFNTNPLCTHY